MIFFSDPVRSSAWWFGNPPILIGDGYIVGPHGARISHPVEVRPKSCILVTRYAQAEANLDKGSNQIAS